MRQRMTLHPRLGAVAILWLLLFSLPGSGQGAVSVEKSPNDPREYRALTLENGLKVMLIHDADTDKASASLDVAVGSGSDPDNREGLAHFLEHMLFLGTRKYPDAGEYAAFVSEHGGSNNAYTAFANTNYYFDIEAAYLEPALDRFAQFFVAPLFTPELVEREKNAVHSEFTGKLKTDGRRFWSARGKALNPAHPMTRFSTGNLETLADREDGRVRDDLIEFYEAYYSSNIMALAVIGRESLDTLEKWVRDRFSVVPNRNSRMQAFDTPLYADNSLPSKLSITPLKEQRFVALSFPVPKRQSLRETRPAGYVGNILGHEGEGSLLSSLKAEGWVESLSAGGGIRNRRTATFDISIGLTEAGVAHIDDIIERVFQAVRLVRESGPRRWLYDEGELLAELAFRFQEKSEPASLVRGLASRLHEWPAAKVLSGLYRTERFSEADIKELAAHLRPDNVAILLVAPGLETNARTKWYDTPYRLEPVDPATVRRWATAERNPEIKLPEPNSFVPRDLTLVAPGETKPRRLVTAPGLTLWHQSDVEFGVPRANFYFSVRSRVTRNSAREMMLTELFTRIVDENLNEFSYPAALAGLSYSIYRHARGFSVRLGGYSDGQHNMLKRIVDVIRKPGIDPDVFRRLRDEIIREIRDVEKEPPYEQTINEVRRFLTVPFVEPDARIAALDALTPRDLKDFVPVLLDAVDIVMLSHGNVTAEQSKARSDIVRNALLDESPAKAIDRPRIIRLDTDARYVHEVDIKHNDSSIAIYIQGPERSREARAQFAILTSILSQPFYEELRTTQQIGYYVFATSMTMSRVPGVLLSLQSPATGPAKMYERITAFVKDYAGVLADMTDEEFERHRRAVLSHVLEEEKRLTERTRRYWSEIDLEEFGFDSRRAFAAALNAVTLADIQTIYESIMTEQNAGRMTVFNTGTMARDVDGTAAIPGVPGGDRQGFKTGKALFAPL